MFMHAIKNTQVQDNTCIAMSPESCQKQESMDSIKDPSMAERQGGRVPRPRVRCDARQKE